MVYVLCMSGVSECTHVLCLLLSIKDHFLNMEVDRYLSDRCFKMLLFVRGPIRILSYNVTALSLRCALSAIAQGFAFRYNHHFHALV